MTTLSDAIRAVVGGTSINDGLMAYFAANGGVGTNLLDLERSYLLARLSLASSPATTNDLWKQLMVAYPGTFNDQQLAFWLAGGGGSFNSASVFSGARKGFYYRFANKANLFTDSARTTPVAVATDLIGSATDLSGNSYHAAQAGAARPAWNNGRAEFSSGDFLKALNVDFSGTDVVTVVAAVFKDTGAGTRSIIEHGSNAGSEPGVSLFASPFSGASGFGVNSRGTALAAANNSPNSPAPIYAVVTGIYRVSTDTCVLRVNGQVAEIATTDQGTGNFQLADLYVNAGADGTNFFFGTNQYALLGIDKELTEDDLNGVESDFGSLVGVTIGPAKFTLTAMGDSYTYAINGGVTANQAFVKVLDSRLSRVTYSVNVGISGNTTGNMMARRWQILRVATPNMCTIYGGQNDSVTTTVQASPSPTTTTFSVAAGQGTRYGVDGWITVGGVQAQILSIATDAITLTAPLAGGAPVAGAVVANDTQKNLTELALYVKNAGCKRVMILGRHYDNLASGADTTTVELPANAALRAKQQAAATAAGVVYVDLYAWMRALIIAGTRTQGNFAEHVSSSDSHLTALGQTTIADAVEATIIAQGWT